jgi:RHS repeat-associated protein
MLAAFALSASAGAHPTPFSPLSLAVARLAPQGSSVKQFCGTVSSNQTWSPAIASVYEVTCPTTVAPGATLTLAAGTVVKFDIGASLDINGGLVAAGTSSAEVYLTSINDNSVGGSLGSGRPSAGDWAGISVYTGSGATAAPAVNLNYTSVSYDSSFDVTNASAVALTNSTFVRGAGSYCCGPEGGVQVTAAGPINVSNDQVIGVAQAGGSYSEGIFVAQQRGSAATTVSGNTVQNADSTAVQVSSTAGSVTARNNSVSGGTGRAFDLSSGALVPGAIAGNTSSGDGQNVLGVTGTLAANWVMPYAGLPVVIEGPGGLTVPQGFVLSLAAGTVLKFDPSASLQINGALSAAGTSSAEVYLTSINDNSVGGAFGNGVPNAGDWAGISAAAGGSVDLEHTAVSYAQIGLAGSGGGSVVVKNDAFAASATNAVALSLTSAPTLEDSSSSGSGSDWPAFSVDSSKLNFGLLGGNSASGGGMRVFDVSGTVETSSTMPAGSLPWEVGYRDSAINFGGASNLDVPDGVTLTIARGGVLKGFEDGVSVEGSLVSAGTSGSPVTFTSINDNSIGGSTGSGSPQAGDWSGIYVACGAVASLPYTVIDYASVTYEQCPTPPPVSAAETYGTGSGDSVNPSGYQAEPVNTATGAYNTTMTDGSLPGLGVTLGFTRSYTSANSYSGPLGPGWTDSLNVFLTSQANGNVVLSSGAGQQTTYTLNADGSYAGDVGSRSVLAARTGGGWLLVRQNQDHLYFNASGQLTSEVDRNGAGLSLAYNGSGLLSSVTDSAGRTVSFSYNTSGLLASMSLPLARTVSYTYTGSGELASVTDAAGGVTSYSYNSAGLLAAITNQDGKQIVANTYDSSGRVVQQVNASGGTSTFSYSNGTTTYTDPAGNQWQDVYSDNVLIERIDPTGGATSYGYDANLDRTAVTDPRRATTSMVYDPAGNVTSETSPLGGTQSWTYDALNDVTSHTDADANTTTYSYDAKGNLLKTTLPDGSAITETHDPSTGAVTSQTNQHRSTTSYGYDGQGNLTSVTSPLGEETTYSYDAAGRRTSMVSPRGNASGGNPARYTTSYAYDANDRLASVTNPDGAVTSYGYDGVGNRTSVTDPDGNTTSYAYDADNRLVSVTDPTGAVTKYGYDADGNRTSVATPDGGKTSYVYDAGGRLVKKTDPLGNVTTYSYDADGNRTSVTDATGASTTYGYDTDNRVTGISYSDSTPSVSYAYDAQGNRTSMSDGTGITSYGYNARNELTTLTSPAGTFSYTYDKAGNVTGRIYPDGSAIGYTYDADGRLASLNADGQTTSYTYSADSQPITETLPAANGYTETTSYDPAGLISSISDTNGSGTLTSFSYSYDQAGNPTTVVTPNQTNTYSYDKNNRITGACYGSACAGGQISYSYDGDGNRTQLVDSTGTTSNSYNAADQLTSSSGPSGTTSYSYDTAGRLTAAGTTSYTYNAANEVTSVSNGSSSTSYAYDGNGIRATATTGGSTTSFVYDTNTPSAAPLLVLEQQSGSTIRRYVYGNQLISMRAGGSNYYIAHDAQASVVGLTSATGQTEATYSYDPYGGQLTAKTTNGAPTTSLRYESQYLDPTGLYHLAARQYNPTTGTFTSADPLTPNPNLPAVSPYLYADDMPTVLQDPTGQSSAGGSCGSLSSFGGDVAQVCGLYQTGYNGVRSAVGGPWDEASGAYFGPGSNAVGTVSTALTLYGLYQTTKSLQQQANQIDQSPQETDEIIW